MKKTAKILCAFLTATSTGGRYSVRIADTAANAPGTGDESPVGVWAGLLILSAGTLAAVLILQRRKHIR